MPNGGQRGGLGGAQKRILWRTPQNRPSQPPLSLHLFHPFCRLTGFDGNEFYVLDRATTRILQGLPFSDLQVSHSLEALSAFACEQLVGHARESGCSSPLRALACSPHEFALWFIFFNCLGAQAPHAFAVLICSHTPPGLCRRALNRQFPLAYAPQRV